MEILRSSKHDRQLRHRKRRLPGNRLISALLLVGATAVGAAPQLPSVAVGEPIYAGILQDRQISEASGMAASNEHRDVLWLHNDSGHSSVLYATDLSGALLGKVTVKGVQNRDWEDLTSFRWRGRNFLLIADSGDNLGIHPHYELVVVEEPKQFDNQILKPAWKLRYQFDEGPQDCEAVAVDEATQTIFLLSKRTVPAYVYSLPLRGEGQLTPHRVAALTHIPQPTAESIEKDPAMGRYRSQPTGFSMHGNKAVILTYKHAYVYSRSDSESWADSFSREPALLNLPFLLKGEAITYSADGHQIFATSEVWPAPLIRIDLDD